MAVISVDQAHEPRQPLSPQAAILLEYSLMLLRSWKFIFLTGWLFAIATLALLLMSGKVYQATATLAISPPPYREPIGKNNTEAQEISQLMPPPMHVKDYEMIINSDAVVAKVQEKLLRSGELSPAQEKHYANLMNLMAALSTRVEINEKTATVTEYSKVVKLQARAKHDPKLAADLANMWADAAGQVILENSQRTRLSSTEYLGEEYTNSTSALEEAEDRLQASEDDFDQQIVNQENETEDLVLAHTLETDLKIKEMTDKLQKELRELKAELNLVLEQAKLIDQENIVTDYTNKATKLEEEITETAERVAGYEEQLKVLQEKRVLTRDVAEELEWLDKLGDGEATPLLPQDKLGLRLSEEEFNPIYDRARAAVSSLGVELETLRSRKAFYEQDLPKQEALQEQMVAKVQEIEYQLDERERNQQLEIKTYGDQRAKELEELKRLRAKQLAELQRQAAKEKVRLEREVEQQKQKFNALHSFFLAARLAVADESNDIVSVGPAVPINEHAGLSRKLVVLGAGIFGLLIGAAYVVIAHFFRSTLPALHAEMLK